MRENRSAGLQCQEYSHRTRRSDKLAQNGIKISRGENFQRTETERTGSGRRSKDDQLAITNCMQDVNAFWAIRLEAKRPCQDSHVVLRIQHPHQPSLTKKKKLVQSTTVLLKM